MPDTTPNQILDSMMRDAPFGIMRVDASGTVQAWSAEAASILGWSAREMIGKPAPEAIMAAYTSLAQGLQKNRQLNHTLNCLKRGGGSIEIRLRFTVLGGRKRENGFMAFFWDNTPDRTAEEEKEQLIASERAAQAAAKAESRF